MDKIKAKESMGSAEGIITDFTFDNFVSGSCNELSVAACQAVVEQPGEVYNPLYIHGRTGTGKTHLAHAIANAFVAAGVEKIVVQTGESFVNGLIAAIRTGTTQEFRNKYRNADVLIIDDVQFIAGKARSQDEFFHLFNSLYELKKQIVLTSDCSPKGMVSLEERLCSRFSSGLVAYLPLPNLDTRLAFISKKSEVAGIVLDDETVSLLASRISYSCRALEGALTTLVAHAVQTGKAIETGVAKEILRDQLRDEVQSASVNKVSPESNKMLLIGMGGAGNNMARGMLDHGFTCDRHLYVGSSEWIKELPDRERLYFEYEKDDEAHSASEVRDMLRRPQRAFIKEKFEAMDAVILTVGLGGMTGGYSALVVADMAAERNLPVIVLATMPFSFESRERQMNAEGQMQLLRQNTQLMLIPNDMIAPLTPGKNMEDALDSLNIGLAHFMSALVMQHGLSHSCNEDSTENLHE
jgi:SpoVK/Ycf46/Vps4 family AAA+-type ATPase